MELVFGFVMLVWLLLIGVAVVNALSRPFRRPRPPRPPVPPTIGGYSQSSRRRYE